MSSPQSENYWIDRPARSDSIKKQYAFPASSRAASSPRTSHDLSKLVESPLLHTPISGDFITQKQIRSALFSTEQDDSLINHESDLDFDEEEGETRGNFKNSQESFTTSALELYERSDMFQIQTVGQDRSLARSLAVQIHNDEDLFASIEEDIMKYEIESQSQYSMNFINPTRSQCQRMLQIISNIHNRPIHLRLATSSGYIQIITPCTLSFQLPLTGQEEPTPLLLLQVNSSTFSSMKKRKGKGKKKSIVFKIDAEIINQEVFEFRDEIAQSFMKGQKWSEDDERRHQLIIQGPASLEDLTATAPILPSYQYQSSGIGQLKLEESSKFTSTSSFDDNLELALSLARKASIQ